MSEKVNKQFRAALTSEELRQINIDAASRNLDRVEWFTQAIKSSPSWRRLFPKESK